MVQSDHQRSAWIPLNLNLFYISNEALRKVLREISCYFFFSEKLLLSSILRDKSHFLICNLCVPYGAIIDCDGSRLFYFLTKETKVYSL